MRIIPEYEPVGKLYLSFVREFFHSRFGIGDVICDIAAAVSEEVTVEVFVSDQDRELLEELLERRGVDPGMVTLNSNASTRGFLAEYFPILAEDDRGRGVGVLFRDHNLDDCEILHQFSRRVISDMGFLTLQMDLGFATAKISVNEDLCLVSDCSRGGNSERGIPGFFKAHFENQAFVPVPPLAEDVTTDLDMFLWPIRPGLWLVSEYPRGSSQEESIQPSIRAIREHGHRVIRIPGLERIVGGDIDTIPNYANGILINDLALYPAYGRREDQLVGNILEEFGYQPLAIDCRKLIRANGALHCISKTVPAAIM